MSTTTQEAVNLFARTEADHPDEVRGMIRRIAREAHAGRPQYDGHWDGDDWVLLRATFEEESPSGVAVCEDDYVIGVLGTTDTDPHVTVYSLRTDVDTVLPAETFYRACALR